MKNFELKGKLCDNGSIVLDNWNDIKEALNKLINADLSVKISKNIKHRSVQQNRYYWGVVIPTIIAGIKEQEGIRYSPEEIHLIICKLILKIQYKVIEYEGETIITLNNKRTSEMTTEEFVEFINDIQQHFAERDIIIPDPKNENFFNDFNTGR